MFWDFCLSFAVAVRVERRGGMSKTPADVFQTPQLGLAAIPGIVRLQNLIAAETPRIQSQKNIDEIQGELSPLEVAFGRNLEAAPRTGARPIDAILKAHAPEWSNQQTGDAYLPLRLNR